MTKDTNPTTPAGVMKELKKYQEHTDRVISDINNKIVNGQLETKEMLSNLQKSVTNVFFKQEGKSTDTKNVVDPVKEQKEIENWNKEVHFIKTKKGTGVVMSSRTLIPSLVFKALTQITSTDGRKAIIPIQMKNQDGTPRLNTYGRPKYTRWVKNDNLGTIRDFCNQNGYQLVLEEAPTPQEAATPVA